MDNSGQWRTILFVSIAALLTCTSVTASPFQLVITDNASPTLPIYIAIYPASAKDWDSEPTLRLHEVLPETQTAEIALDLPPGEYAIRAFVDHDNNGALNLNHRGHPAEPYASSLSPERNRRSQRFEHAIIMLTADQPSVSIGLTYPRSSDD